MAVSTFYNAKYDRSKFMDVVEVEVGKGKNAMTIPIVDRLDNDYIDLINSLNQFERYECVSGDNLPNISYAFYKTTTAWWIIARVNGIVDPLSIQAGDILLIPQLKQINKKVSNVNTSNLGKVVVF